MPDRLASSQTRGAPARQTLGDNDEACRPRGQNRQDPMTRISRTLIMALATSAALLAGVSAKAQVATVYRCPGPPVLYTDALSPDEARERGCRTIEGAPVTVIQGNRPRGAAAGPPRAGASNANPSINSTANPAASGADARIDPAAQRLRDADARRILEAELRREEDKLTLLRRDYNNGEPERRGDERNFQNYLDRVAQMKAGISRSEADVAALKRELSKLPP